MFVRTILLVAVASGLFGCAQPPTEAPGAAASAARGAADIPSAGAHSMAGKPENRAMYRFDFTFASTEPGKPTTTTAYTLNLEEHSKGEINMGRNVPLQVNPVPSGSAAPAASASALPRFGVPRQDVGFLLRCSFASSGDDLMLDSLVEMSSVSPTPDARGVNSIQKLNLKGNALVTPGKTSVVSSSEDPATHQRYQLSVTATKLR